MFARAYDETDARLQEEVLKKTVSLAKKFDVQVISSCFLLVVLKNVELVRQIILCSLPLVEY